jgi:hypothetical protein
LLGSSSRPKPAPRASSSRRLPRSAFGDALVDHRGQQQRAAWSDLEDDRPRPAARARLGARVLTAARSPTCGGAASERMRGCVSVHLPFFGVHGVVDVREECEELRGVVHGVAKESRACVRAGLFPPAVIWSGLQPFLPSRGHDTKVTRLSGWPKVSGNAGFAGDRRCVRIACERDGDPDWVINGREGGQMFSGCTCLPDTRPESGRGADGRSH